MASDPIQTTEDGSSNPLPGQVVSFHQSISYSGPLPSPEVLAGFETAFKGCAERIVSMAERQAKHRQECERLMLEAPITDASASRAESRRGQVFAFILAIAAFLTAGTIIVLVPNGAGATVASVIGGTTIVGIVATFIVGRKMAGEKETNNSGKPEK